MFSTVRSSFRNKTAYEVVASYLSNHLAISTSDINKGHIQIVSKAALKYLKQMDPSTKKWKTKALTEEQEGRLCAAVKYVLLSDHTPWKPEIANLTLSDRQKMILSTIQGSVPPVNDFFKDRELLQAVWKKSPEILMEARDLLNTLFIDMQKQIDEAPLSKNESFHMEIVIGELLALYPFLGAEEGEELQVPVYIEGKWHLISYNIERISLTPKEMGSPLMAFGLVPHSEEAAPPILLFKGTTYPSDEGFGLSIITDLNPLASIGTYAFRLSKPKIEEWLKKHTSRSKAVIYGKSLGGAQAWRTAFYLPKYVDKVMAYAAPGFSLADLKRWDQVRKRSVYPKIHFFCQPNDPVPYIDLAAPKGINYYHVIGKQARKGIIAHADMYATHEESLIIRLDPTQGARKWKRLGITLFRGVASIVFFPLLVLAYGAHMTRKNIKKILQSRKITVISSQNLNLFKI